ncbi:MAG: RelA/SpoT family protein [bacterium]
MRRATSAREIIMPPAAPATESKHAAHEEESAQSFVERAGELADERDDSTDDDLRAARRWARAQCGDGDDLQSALDAGREAVGILRPLGMDAQGLLAAQLLPILPLLSAAAGADAKGDAKADAKANAKIEARIAERFGATTLALLQRAARMRQLSALSRHGAGNADPNADEENLRKMLIAMVDDVRVVLIELARHLARLHRAKHADRDAQIAIAHATVEVYAPLANRLGVRQLKWRMDDCALRFLHPDEYHHLAARLREKRAEREAYIGAFIADLQRKLSRAGIAGEVHGRPKHLYSIWRKMRRKGLAFEALHDLRAVRILVDSVADCYFALALVHANWRQLPQALDDYIAVPKNNGYRSIHSVVVGPRERVVEVQIRTREMHRQSELGIAAHWRYKENVRADDGIDDKVRRLRQLLEWKAEVQYGACATDESLRDDAVRDAEQGDDDRDAERDVEQHDNAEPRDDDRVYAFTPKGAVIDLPRGATPIDFAYAIHTEIGHSIRGAQVNGRIAPLNRPLRTGDQVRIQTAKGGNPSRDWLRRDLGYARTRRARARIAHWFKRADHAQHIADGRALLERELPRLGLADLGYDKIARAGAFNTTDDLLAALGASHFKLSRALAPFRRATERTTERPTESRKPNAPKLRSKPPRAPASGAFSVSGVDNLLTRMAHCCHPIPGDDIIGFVTVGHGVSIHRLDCRNIKRLDERRRERLVEVKWLASLAGSESD